MKPIRFVLATIAVAASSVAAAAQQQQPPPRPAQPPASQQQSPARPSPVAPGGQTATKPAATTPAALPKGKIAVINTAVFQDKVAEFKQKIDALNRQFEPRVKEVQTLADKITALENTLKTNGNLLSASKVAEQTEQLEAMKKEYQRKGEDLQADAGRARDKAFEPISAKLGKFAEDYTAKHGIVLLVDLANAIQSGTVLWYDARADVTQDFVNEYNKANPVPTAAAPPAAKPTGQK
ncbi:MAG TPA: OmpH family outer membrane protein [Blastocatellia bacterium]|nr:OmpH family outer membrane protein [Blastocatellia bacterium]